MNDSIQISPAVIGGNHIDAVSAKQLHEALGAKSKNVEIGRICGRSKATVRSHRRKMEACGLLEPPANLKQMQQMSLRLLPGGAS